MEAGEEVEVQLQLVVEPEDQVAVVKVLTQQTQLLELMVWVAEAEEALFFLQAVVAVAEVSSSSHILKDLELIQN
jgi:hypothetical protein